MAGHDRGREEARYNACIIWQDLDRGGRCGMGAGCKELQGGGVSQRWRGTARRVVASWHCGWGFVMAACLLVYSLAIFGWSPSCAERGRHEARGVQWVAEQEREQQAAQWSGDLRKLDTAWNRLCFGPPPESLRMALFVKKWPVGGTPGGLERHAMTLHRVLAERGHIVHVFTTSPEMENLPRELLDGKNLEIHILKPNAGGGFDHAEAWERFVNINASAPFECVHSESVALPHWRAREVPRLAASWHGIAYETIHSDIVHDLTRKPGEPRSPDLQKSLAERVLKVADEVRFFHSYNHHVATSDYVGDVLRTIYEIPLERVHIILNGVDQVKFHPDPAKGAAFLAKHGVPRNASLVLGAAGRLVRDKGHPLLFDAFSHILKERKDVYLLVAGNGPWGDRYRELAPNAKMLGPMTPWELADFYNAIDVFVNPTLRAQGLDHTLLEAMQCGKPLLATHFSSITWSVVVSKDFGYTFSPNVEALTAALFSVIHDGREALRKKGRMCLEYAALMFTASKMGAAYERLFLCMKNDTYCYYPLSSDCTIRPPTYSRIA